MLRGLLRKMVMKAKEDELNILNHFFIRIINDILFHTILNLYNQQQNG